MDNIDNIVTSIMAGSRSHLLYIIATSFLKDDNNNNSFEQTNPIKTYNFGD